MDVRVIEHNGTLEKQFYEMGFAKEIKRKF